MLRSVALLLAAVVAVAIATGGGGGHGHGHGHGHQHPHHDNCYYERQFDGTCNNYDDAELGAAEQWLKRGSEGVHYIDGVREPYTEPSMRQVSNELFRGDDAILSPHGHNLMWTFFGQFVTHDLLGVHRKGDLNLSEIPDSNNSDVWIRVPMLDASDALFQVQPPFPPLTVPYMRVLRSRGEIVDGVFQIGSDSTAFLDLDVVYGKNEHVANLLRKNVGGLLQYRNYVNYTVYPGSGSTVSPTFLGNFGEWLPLFADVDPNRTFVPLSNQLVGVNVLNVPQRALAAGDGRNAENYALQVIQGLFLREHNRLARQFKIQNPSWSDERLFAAARRWNIAQYQSIVMYEYLPSLLLRDTSRLGRYTGYDDSADPTPTHLFAFAFRFGHTTVPNVYPLLNGCKKPAFNSTRDGPRSGQMFGQQMGADQIAQAGNPENILHPMLYLLGGKIDVQFPESLRTIRGANTDIIVQNQMRAAEHGLPGYHKIRKIWHGAPHADLYASYGPCAHSASEHSPSPDPLACFLYINSNTTIATKLRSLYGKITHVNFYTAVVAEEPRLAAVGQTSARIIADQFKRIRDGDRWWFEGNDAGFTNQEIRNLRKNLKMSTLLQRNFPSAHIQTDAFYAPPAEFFSNCD